MLTQWNTKPHRPFLITGVLALIVSIIYYFYYRESYFDITVGNYFEISSYYAWTILGLYALILGTIYYIAHRNNLKTRRWLVITHYVFLVLFLALFFAFSSFGTHLVQDLLQEQSFFAILTVYASLYFLDIFLLVSGIILLVANLSVMKRK